MRLNRLLPWLVLCAVLAPLHGCFVRRCGPNQELKGEVCLCKPGTKVTDDIDCVPLEPTSDAGGGADGTPDGSIPHDAALSGGGGGPSCSPSLVDGVGCECTTDQDCAGFKADYCMFADPANPQMKRACLLQGCDQPGRQCPTGDQCCSFLFAPEETICLPSSIACPFK